MNRDGLLNPDFGVGIRRINKHAPKIGIIPRCFEAVMIRFCTIEGAWVIEGLEDSCEPIIGRVIVSHALLSGSPVINTSFVRNYYQ